MATPFNPLSQKLEQYQRQRAIAEQLVKQGTTPLQSTNSGTGNHPIVVAPSKFQAFSQIAQALGGQYLQSKADDKYAELAKAMQSGQAEAIKSLGDSKDSASTAAAANSATQYGVDPQVVNALVTSKLKRDKIDAGNSVKITDDSGNVLNEIAKAATPGEVLSNQSTIRGQDITTRGQDLTNTAALRGQDISAKTAIRGQDVGANTATRGQDIGAETSRRGQDLTSQAEAAKIAAATGKQKPLTEFQAKGVGQLARMQGAEQTLDKNYRPGYTNQVEDLVPGSQLNTQSFEKYKQSANEFIAGLLRLDSGAAVPEVEFNRYFKTYFPQAGEGEDVIAQKAASRQRAIEALRTSLQSASDLVPKPPSKSDINPDMAAEAKAELARRGLK